VLPALWPSLRSVWLGAGPVPEIWHRALNALAWAVRLKLLPSLSPLARLMFATMNRLSFGEHRGGKTDVWLKVVVPTTSLCPCSKKISDYGAHNQRAHITLTAKLVEHMWLE